LWAPSAAIVNPWEMGLAMAETAVVNGCDLKLSFEVKSIDKEENCYLIKSENDEVRAKYVINASGVNTDAV
ncbi:FAD-dependent oxidoreductase, partial [Acinetobacter baumannii]|nr:FAD-dependent oxidoreductase [Acinetobacter baumannii]